MHAANLVLLALCLPVMTACADPQSAPALPLRSVSKGAFSGITDVRQEVIRDKEAFAKVWDELQARSRPRPSLPEIDFAREMLVLVTLGQRRTGGFSIEVVNVEVRQDRLRVGVRRQNPAPGAMVIEVLTSPFHLVAVPKSDLRPEFVEIGNTKPR
jgi:hypothetical protein